MNRLILSLVALDKLSKNISYLFHYTIKYYMGINTYIRLFYYVSYTYRIQNSEKSRH
ncbi:MAG: hypothetical protein US30_C0022G0014 [Candidatus Moranbacteria bacterium GW2011_GWF2_36_839]|nr:MAG: hypothetical protein US30_C0022G0014 [Candidatus Moranbacteria bacterium GW2011_GWF2_36_839]